MDNKTIEQCFLNVKVIHAFKDSRQKVVFLIDHPMHKISILKIVKEMNERITREIDIATKYNIKNIPRIFEFDTIEIYGKKYAYIIEEYIEGNNLSNEIKKNQISLDKSLNLLESLLKTAVELENSKIVHRDIKPDNIICSNTGEYYLIDFGIARILNASSLTFTKAIIGPHTPGCDQTKAINKLHLKTIMGVTNKTLRKNNDRHYIDNALHRGNKQYSLNDFGVIHIRDDKDGKACFIIDGIEIGHEELATMLSQFAGFNLEFRIKDVTEDIDVFEDKCKSITDEEN